ncbi:TPA: hypothetical protein M4731_001407 [Salmonella enterica]|nr:hypothetical protein [Salmonella enterica]MCH5735375.1 hypothetical protein [Salmonella enterica]MCH5741809.1 hypothetical protein [Salmonella enterica]MCH5746907.1 hypothetical protein [Salmonella enterica]MCH5757089.1 hypothetical protein [Salmonella enterica]
MASPLIMIGDELSVRANCIVAVEVSGSTVIVYPDTGYAPFCIDMDNCAAARDQRNRILAAVHDAEKVDFLSMGGRSSTNALHAEPLETDSTKNTPDERGLPRVSKIAGLLQREFGDELERTGFQQDLWIALQVVYGPSGAAHFIAGCQNPRR